jgi:hypothetical protein
MMDNRRKSDTAEGVVHEKSRNASTADAMEERARRGKAGG